MATRRKSRSARKAAPARTSRRPARKTARRAKAAPPRTKRKISRPKPRRPVAKRAARRTAAPAIASAVGVTQQHVDYTTQALPEVRRFYTELLGFSRFEFEEGFNYLLIHTGPASSLGFMPPGDVPPEMWRPPREPALFFFVADVDRAHAGLVARGVEFVQAPTDTDWGHRVAVLRDPEGRTVCLAQPLPR